MTGSLHIAAAILRRADGAALLVRKRGTRAFMQPGGKIDPGETPRAALARELAEELGLKIDPDAATFVGTVTAPAAHEPGTRVIAALFDLGGPGDVTPRAEIEELRWIGSRRDAAALDLAPLTRDHVLPRLWP